jgi:hypothetical protein
MLYKYIILSTRFLITLASKLAVHPLTFRPNLTPFCRMDVLVVKVDTLVPPLSRGRFTSVARLQNRQLFLTDIFEALTGLYRHRGGGGTARLVVHACKDESRRRGW